MKPLGRRPVKFPSKTKQWLGRGVRMWWEGIVGPCKTRDKQQVKREISKEIDDL